MVYVNEMTVLLPLSDFGSDTALKLKGKEGEGLKQKKVAEIIFILRNLRNHLHSESGEPAIGM
ncbi:hypothetical protein [Peribacillus frigoritolerans]|uniref:hypothetical protein n=1 Tax=Peribacillus frigoritolerans TaxID=450367 RepID=UPI0023D9E743|nr:hypothetical protein [Peribacillus frigoritolerans]MDF1997760.1 hypothetical protein [Peribacillus frigoritolerans]